MAPGTARRQLALGPLATIERRERCSRRDGKAGGFCEISVPPPAFRAD